MNKRFQTISAVIALGACLVIAVARGEEPAPKRGADAGAHPLLRQLNAEVQSLYNEVQAGVCRVQLPPPRWAGAPIVERDNLLEKWGGQLDPAVKARLEQEQKDVLQKGRYQKISATVDAKAESKAATQPAAAAGQQQPPPQQHGHPATRGAAGNWTLSPGEDGTLTFRPGSANAGTLRFDAGGNVAPDGQIVGAAGRVNVNVAAGGSFTPNNVGLLLDAQGHILVPICVEKETVDPEGVPVMVGPGQMARAKFVGSDRQTNITLLKLDKPLGTPVKLAKTRPDDGALTMFLAPNSGVGRLVIWSNEIKDWGVVVGMDGGVYGFTRQGQFLSAAACKPAIDQLARGGSVRRAKLGVGIAEVSQNDPLRETSPLLGTQPAVRVSEVAPNSAAASAGLKVGDLILHCNDQPVGDPSGFAAAMSDPSPKVSLQLLRDNRAQTIQIDVPQQDR